MRWLSSHSSRIDQLRRGTQSHDSGNIQRAAAQSVLMSASVQLRHEGYARIFLRTNNAPTPFGP